MSTQIRETSQKFSLEAAPQPHRKRWTNAQFEQMIELGLFDRTRTELIDGEIIEMSPMLEPHALTLMLAQDQCYRVFSLAEFAIRNQSPFFVGEGYRPEPDIAVVRRADLSLQTPPSNALLIIEVSDSTLRFDRSEKASLYARAGVEDYWILNVNQRNLEVRRAPRADAMAPYGFSYAALQTFEIGEVVSPRAAPDSSIAVSDLLA